MPKSELVALVDLDGTLADYDTAMRRDMAKLAGPHDIPYDPHATLQHCMRARENLIKNQPDWWYNLEPIDSNFKVVDIMRKLGFSIHILTQGPRSRSNAWAEKVRWVQKYLPDDDITITRDKGLVYGKVLFDDYAGYVSRWLEWRPRGLAIMPAYEDNVLIHPDVIRYTKDNLLEIKSKLEAIVLASV